MKYYQEMSDKIFNKYMDIVDHAYKSLRKNNFKNDSKIDSLYQSILSKFGMSFEALYSDYIEYHIRNTRRDNFNDETLLKLVSDYNFYRKNGALETIKLRFSFSNSTSSSSIESNGEFLMAKFVDMGPMPVYANIDPVQQIEQKFYEVKIPKIKFK